MLQIGGLSAQVIQPDSASLTSQKNLLKEVNFLMEQYQYQEALDKIDALVQDSISPKLQYLEGVCCMQLGRYGKANKIFNTILQGDTSNVKVINQLATLFSKTENYKKAYYYKSELCKLDTNNAYLYRMAADAARKAKLYPDAKALYSSAINKNKTDIESLISLSGLLLMEEDFNQCDSILNIAYSIDSNNIKLLNRMMRYNYETKQYEQSLKLARKLYNYDPNDKSVINILGISCYQTERYQQAIYWIDMILEDEEEASDAHYYYKGLCWMKMLDYEKAKLAFEEAIEKAISPSIKSYYLQKAIAETELQEYSEAIPLFRQALYYGGNNNIRYQLANIYESYYADKSTALGWYKAFLVNKDDKTHPGLILYSIEKVKQLKEKQHFGSDN